MRISWLGVGGIALGAALVAALVMFPGASAAAWGAVPAFVGGITLLVRGIRGKPDFDNDH